MPRTRSYTPEFKAEVIKALLVNIAVPTEFSSRFGVAPWQIRRWIVQMSGHLNEVFEDTPRPLSTPPARPNRFPMLSRSELNVLLRDLE